MSSSKLDKFLDAVQGKGVEIRAKTDHLGEKLSSEDLEVVTGGDGSKLGINEGPVCWSLPFPPPPGPVNPWVLSTTPAPPGHVPGPAPTPPPPPPGAEN